ncbi:MULTISPECIES: bifunctional 4-hydroxy-2-oxoglutarate aldolase/2-dehydro-3-deoxy-phosphogluconate aldolase [unclassified Rathayibacter]|uniref:bifunctional 4-hydroxy-2-oxoglutarate aldolase/2-dehydro-3-deoxy-phosphogluconate aldolase n=1 Tax=unclassified Rathayibacter TaxID=2609250 RepID=UPI0007020F18|nr:MULTISPECIES: bifunctional 4-hydroxy-2-oxoglutarate aldolase/2-dehydro-3-deoxy-phosphogluconate aldolase [unclassified Rathayibacter]KQQ05529.1 2-dehydro-3-deoxyphosphogluconate aldolase [Rathayibacter sp. Leaf294]KQS13392.1 2-dehydro-3-deoxyphosphogluconate aldolase [Rathayibacter sp. Leaf185]
MTVTGSWFDGAFADSPIMAILRGTGTDRAVRLAETAWNLGIDSVEVTIQSAEDEEALREVVRRASAQGKSVGAGTVLTREQVRIASDAGASFVVAPGFDPSIVDEAEALGMPVLPGVATPGEVQLAYARGLRWMKAFPAEWLGVGWFGHIRGPFPDVRFVATGGLGAGNVSAFLDAGVRVAAVGSALEDPAQLALLAEILRTRRGAGLGSAR